jgi:hypothetical protein
MVDKGLHEALRLWNRLTADQRRRCLGGETIEVGGRQFSAIETAGIAGRIITVKCGDRVIRVLRKPP